MKKTLSITECAERLGLTRQAVFYRIKNKSIDASQGEDGRWEVVDNEKVAVAKGAAEVIAGAREVENQEVTNSDMQELMENNQNLQKRIDRLEQRLNELSLEKSDSSISQKYFVLAVVSAITFGISSLILYFMLSHFQSHETHHHHDGGEVSALP